MSAVAYDWLATAKPLVITEPARTAYRPVSPLLDRLPLLAPHETAGLVGRLRARQSDAEVAELARYYFGETADGASSRRFADAIDAAYALTAR